NTSAPPNGISWEGFAAAIRPVLVAKAWGAPDHETRRMQTPTRIMVAGASARATGAVSRRPAASWSLQEGSLYCFLSMKVRQLDTEQMERLCAFIKAAHAVLRH